MSDSYFKKNLEKVDFDKIWKNLKRDTGSINHVKNVKKNIEFYEKESFPVKLTRYVSRKLIEIIFAVISNFFIEISKKILIIF